MFGGDDDTNVGDAVSAVSNIPNQPSTPNVGDGQVQDHTGDTIDLSY
jgi:hypothetical protein